MLGELEVIVHSSDFDCYYVTERERGFYNDELHGEEDDPEEQNRYEGRMSAYIEMLPDLLSFVDQVAGGNTEYDDLSRKAEEILSRLT